MLFRSMGADISKLRSLRSFVLSKGGDGRYTLTGSKLVSAIQSAPAGVRATLQKLGSLVEKATGKELADDGGITQVNTALLNKTSLLQTQKSALQKALQQYTSVSTTESS